MKDIIVVTSGKGGVGKSTLSGLIGLYLSKNFKVLLIDADLGLTNLELIFNAIKSKFDISDVISSLFIIFFSLIFSGDFAIKVLIGLSIIKCFINII